jgi:hypothetical protein
MHRAGQKNVACMVFNTGTEVLRDSVLNFIGLDLCTIHFSKRLHDISFMAGVI